MQITCFDKKTNSELVLFLKVVYKEKIYSDFFKNHFSYTVMHCITFHLMMTTYMMVVSLDYNGAGKFLSPSTL